MTLHSYYQKVYKDSFIYMHRHLPVSQSYIASWPAHNMPVIDVSLWL